MELNAEFPALILNATMIIAAVVFAIVSTGIVESKIVLGPDGLNIKSPPTQILLVSLFVFVMIL